MQICSYAGRSTTDSICVGKGVTHFLAVTGRPGPSWIDIPVNYQGCTVETDDLREGYDPAEDDRLLPQPVSKETVREVLEKVAHAQRPVLYAGNGIRLSGGYDEFRKAVQMLGIPVCTYWDAIDLIETEHPLYCGRRGQYGESPAEFCGAECRSYPCSG